MTLRIWKDILSWKWWNIVVQSEVVYNKISLSPLAMSTANCYEALRMLPKPVLSFSVWILLRQLPKQTLSARGLLTSQSLTLTYYTQSYPQATPFLPDL